MLIIFKKAFVYPLGRSTFDRIIIKTNPKTDLTKRELDLTSFDRSIFLNFYLSNNISNFEITTEMIPSEAFSNGRLNLNMISSEFEITPFEIAIIRIYVEAYIHKFGLDNYMNKIKELFLLILNTLIDRLGKIFDPYTDKE